MRKELRDPRHATAPLKNTKEVIPTAISIEDKENRRPKKTRDHPKVSFAENVLPRINIPSCSSDTEIGIKFEKETMQKNCNNSFKRLP